MTTISIIARDKTAEETKISDLLKLATVQAEDKDYDSAIDSLRCAYSLMETVATEWPIRTYFRLARYLHLSGRFAEALDWLKNLHDNVDSTCNAREQLYKEWGWMQGRNQPAKISKTLRNNLRRVVKQEIELYMERQHKIEQRLINDKSVGKAARPITPKSEAKKIQAIHPVAPQSASILRGADVGEVLYNFTQYCFVGEKGEEPLDLSAEDYIFARLINGPLTVLEVHQLPSKYRRLLREVLTQYIIFLEINRGLPFPPEFLAGSSKEQLALPLLQYIHEHRWPFPQMLRS